MSKEKIIFHGAVQKDGDMFISVEVDSVEEKHYKVEIYDPETITLRPELGVINLKKADLDCFAQIFKMIEEKNKDYERIF